MIDYIINKEKRTIVAMIKFCDDIEYDSVLTFKDADLIFDGLWSALYRLKHDNNNRWGRDYHNKANKMFFPRYMSAKAKCSPDDEWNEEFGKELARKRLVEKIHNYRSNSYKIIAEVIKELNDKFVD